MRYVSTAGQSTVMTLGEAILAGHAPDGGIYMPEGLPRLPQAFFRNMPDMSLPEIAYVVANTLFSDAVASERLSRMASDALSFPIPLHRISADISALEIFHGPTGSFNDVGALFMAEILPYLNIDPLRPVNFLMATAGDSGLAVAHALDGLEGVKVTVLYPARQLSRTQLNRLLSLGDNVTAVEVAGSLDDCRALADEAFADGRLVDAARLTPASSINIARFLPQIFQYFHAYACVRATGDTRDIILGVPGDNLGNLAAGLVAKRMGLPISRFVAAGVGNTASSRPSNLPRIEWLYRKDLAALNVHLKTKTFSDDEISWAVNALGNRGYKASRPTACAWMALSDELNAASETGVFMAVSNPEPEIVPTPARRPVAIGRSIQALKNHLLTI